MLPPFLKDVGLNIKSDLFSTILGLLAIADVLHHYTSCIQVKICGFLQTTKFYTYLFYPSGDKWEWD